MESMIAWKKLLLYKPPIKRRSLGAGAVAVDKFMRIVTFFSVTDLAVPQVHGQKEDDETRILHQGQRLVRALSKRWPW